MVVAKLILLDAGRSTKKSVGKDPQENQLNTKSIWFIVRFRCPDAQVPASGAGSFMSYFGSLDNLGALDTFRDNTVAQDNMGVQDSTVALPGQLSQLWPIMAHQPYDP